MDCINTLDWNDPSIFGYLYKKIISFADILDNNKEIHVVVLITGDAGNMWQEKSLYFDTWNARREK